MGIRYLSERLNMLMTADRRVAILGAIRGAGANWIDRADIATQTGKDELSPNDIHHLRILELEGYIERREASSSGLRPKFEYRATNKAGQD